MSSEENRYTSSRRCSRAGLTQKVTVCAACVATSSAVKSFDEQLRCRTLWTASCPYVHSELPPSSPYFSLQSIPSSWSFLVRFTNPLAFRSDFPKLGRDPVSGFLKTIAKILMVECVSGSSCCSKVLVGSTGQARVDQALYMGIYARSLFYKL